MLLVGNIQPSILAWWVLRAWAGVVFSGDLACCRLATYSLVPLHGGCSERGLVLCFRSFGVL